MKTQILTFATIASIVLGIGTTAFAADKNIAAKGEKEKGTVLVNVSKISKIEVYGNVELYVSDSEADQVKVYNQYYAENAVVKSMNGVLRISSYNDQKLVVWVKAADLRAISAYDNAEVRSFGKLSQIELTVTLRDDSYAKLNMGGYSISLNANERAKADLSGNVSECTIKYNRSATVNSADIAAEHIIKTVYSESVKNEELVGL